MKYKVIFLGIAILLSGCNMNREIKEANSEGTGDSYYQKSTSGNQGETNSSSIESQSNTNESTNQIDLTETLTSYELDNFNLCKEYLSSAKIDSTVMSDNEIVNFLRNEYLEWQSPTIA